MPTSRLLWRIVSPEPSLIVTDAGRRGPTITRLGFGAWAIGGPWLHGWGPVDDDASKSAIVRAVSGGVNWVDTAGVYGLGHSEEVCGAAIAKMPANSRPLVFTKCGRSWSGGDPQDIRTDLRPMSIVRDCDASLKRLNIDRIDVLQFHRPDAGTPVEESWEAASSLVTAGKVRWLGLSNFDIPLAARCNSVAPVDVIQCHLNLFDRSSLPLIEWASDMGIALVVYSTLASGILSGRFTLDRLANLAEDDWRRRSKHFAPDVLRTKLLVVERLRPIAQKLATSVRHLCIAWTLHQRGVTGAIVGARTAEQVEGWIGASDVVLDEATIAEIDQSCLLADDLE